MNHEPNKCNSTAAAYGVAILGALLIVAALVWAMRHYTAPEPVNANRAAERAKALGELRAAEAGSLHSAGWIDQPKGVVRLPIDVAMSMVEQEWKNPDAARSNLAARAEKAMPTPPPPPPPKPSAFE